MAVKTFTTGEVLTNSDTNTYLANSGLVYVTSQVVGSAVSSVTISGCFSSTYDNYRIIYHGGAASASSSIIVKLGASTTGYYGALVYSSASPAAATAAGHANSASFVYAGYGDTGLAELDFDLLSPNLAKWTQLAKAAWMPPSTFGTYHGTHQVATAYTDFTIAPSSGTLTGGTITVYGYRKA